MLQALYTQHFLFTQNFVERKGEEVYAEQAVDMFEIHEYRNKRSMYSSILCRMIENPLNK